MSNLESIDDTIAKGEYEERVSRLDSLLKAREADYPVRNQSYEIMLRGCEAFALRLLEERRGLKFTPDPSQIHAGRDLAPHPIFIAGAMKSGTTLLTQLLDGHSDLIVMPGDSHYAQNRENWNRERFEALALHWLRRIITPSGKEPFWYLGRNRDSMDRFLNYLEFYLGQDGLDAFQAVVLAMHAGLRPEPPFAKAWVEKTPENECFALELGELYPNARFIHILRDPLENLASLKRLREYRGKDFRVRMQAKALMKLFRLAESNRKTLGPARYLVIQYGQLVHDTESVMREIAHFLGIQFDEGLLTPTENGRPGIANSMYAESRVRGQVLNQAGNRRYLKAFSQEELQKIVSIARDPAGRFGFHWTDDDLLKRG
jgi:hypothetical protein